MAIDKMILQDLSPAQIAGRMALENTLQISHETIYQHIYLTFKLHLQLESRFVSKQQCCGGVVFWHFIAIRNE
ncbi:MAG: hypothetical protein JZU65_08250 [Chlorobium sp.]|nr:hypothetical protein [Chlorobium sp.]